MQTIILVLVVKNPPAKAGDRFDPWVRRILWRRKWQSTVIFLPGKFHGQRSLAGYSPRACVLSHFNRVQLFATLWTKDSQAPLSMGFSKQEYWLEWVAMPFTRGSSQSRDQTHVSYVSCIDRQVLTASATWEALQSMGLQKNWIWLSTHRWTFLEYIRWINNKVLLYSTGNYIQYPVTNYNGKEKIIALLIDSVPKWLGLSSPYSSHCCPRL